MAAIKYIKRTVALDGGSVSDPSPNAFFDGEQGAHTFIIAAMRGGEPFMLSGAVSATFLNANDAVVTITGSIVDGAAVVTLSNPCYELSGRFTLTIDVNGATVYECQSRIKRRSSGTAYDPNNELTVAALSAEIAAMRTATAAANTAATAADTARENMEGIIAPTFSPTEPYRAGHYVWYDGELYQYKVNHDAGSWDAAQAVKVPLSKAVGEMQDEARIYQYLTNNGQYTVTSDDMQNGGWSYSSKVPNTKRIRNANLIPVRAGMQISYSTPTLRLGFWVLASKTATGSFAQIIGFQAAGSSGIIDITANGYLIILAEGTSNINVADYDCDVTISTFANVDHSILKQKYSNLEKNTVMDIMPLSAITGLAHENGVKFVWNEIHTECTIIGNTASALSFSNFFEDASVFPDGMTAGNDYYVHVSGAIDGIVVRFALQPNTLPNRIIDLSSSGVLHIPNDATGLTARINVNAETVIPNGSITLKISILNTLTNAELVENSNRFLTSAEISSLNTLLDVPVNKIFSASGARITGLCPTIDVPILSGKSYMLMCYEYFGSFRYYKLFTADGLSEFVGWTAASHPNDIYWRNYSPDTFNQKKTFNVLIFGNSSTYSTMGYIPSVWAEFCPDTDLKFGLLYSSGQSLAGHLSMFNADTPYPCFSLYESGVWVNSTNSVTGKQALDNDHWDLIIIQQSNDSLMKGLGKEDITNLCDAITNHINYPVLFAMNMPMSRGANAPSLEILYPDISDKEARSDAAFNDIANYCESALEYGYISDVIPCGAAIQNARHTTLKTIGEKEYLSYDDVGHLQNGIGVLCASYTAVLKLMEIACKSGKLFASVYNPTDAQLATINLYTRTMHGECVGVTKANKIIAQKCANMAIKKPYEISTLI